MIDKIVSDIFQNFSAKVFIILNHFIFSVICIIAISKTLSVIVPLRTVEHLFQPNSTLHSLTSNIKGYEILMLGVIFLVFLLVYTVNKYGKTYLNYFLLTISVILFLATIINLIIYKDEFDFKRIPLVGNNGVKYVYVRICLSYFIVTWPFNFLVCLYDINSALDGRSRSKKFCVERWKSIFIKNIITLWISVQSFLFNCICSNNNIRKRFQFFLLHQFKFQ